MSYSASKIGLLVAVVVGLFVFVRGLGTRPYETPLEPTAYVLDGKSGGGVQVRLRPGPLWAPQTRAVRLGELEDDLGGRQLTVWLLPAGRMLLVSDSGEGREALLAGVEGTTGAPVFGPLWHTPRDSGFPYSLAPEGGRAVTLRVTVESVVREGSEAGAFPEPGETRELVVYFTPDGLIFQGMPLTLDPNADPQRMEDLLARLLTAKP